MKTGSLVRPNVLLLNVTEEVFSFGQDGVTNLYKSQDRGGNLLVLPYSLRLCFLLVQLRIIQVFVGMNKIPFLTSPM